MRAFWALLVVFCVGCGGSGSGGAATDSGAEVGSGGVGGGAGTGGGDASTDAPSCPALADGEILGSYLFGLSLTLAPTKPILYRADLTVVSGTLSVSAVPLDTHDRTTIVGPPVSMVSDPIGGGSLHVSSTTIVVPGPANPITGSELTADVELQGEMSCVELFYCGDLLGLVTKPATLDLGGSTFTLEKYQTGGQLPEPVHVNCEMTAADSPLP